MNDSLLRKALQKVHYLFNLIIFNSGSKALAYGYINARIRAWKSKMLKKKDLELLADVKSLYSVLDLLQKSTYGELLKKEVEETNSEQVILKIENILWRSINDQFLTIENSLDQKNKEVLKHIFKYYDPKNMRTVLLAKHKRIDFEEIKNQLLPIGLIDLEMLEQIYKAREFTEILIALKKTQYYHDLHSFMIEKRKLNKEFDKQFITNFELLLDFCNYFEFIVYDKYIIDIPYKNKDSEKIIKIFKDYVDGLNYLKLVEGLKENKDFDKIKLFQCGNINIEKAKRIYVRKQNILILLNHEMKKLLKNEYDTTKLESLINKYFYMKLSKIFKKETLTINAIASYMFMKLHEYSSLLAIIKAKRYGLSKEEIYIL